MIIPRREDCFLIKPEEPFSLSDTLTCGQSFTFSEKDGIFRGVVRHHPVVLYEGEDGFFVEKLSLEEIQDLLIPYLDLDRSYEPIHRKLCRNPLLRKAIAEYGGIRLLRQDPFETLISFIVSQNNNIPRIHGILERLRTCFGVPLAEGFWDFPTPERLAACKAEDLALLRCGFRVPYLLDAARKVADGVLILENLPDMETDEARELLMSVQGVGPKVADCILLFSLDHRRAFPKDIWIKRVMEKAFPKGLPAYFAPYEGYAQQYLFQYVRCSDDPFARALRDSKNLRPSGKK